MQGHNIAKKIRISALVALLVVEFGLYWLIRSRGWESTTTFGRWSWSLMVAIFPLAIIGLILFRNGIRIKLRSAFVCVGFFAAFLSLSVMPITRSRDARTAGIALTNSGATLRPVSAGDFDYDNPSSYNDRIRFSSADDIPEWLSPLVGNLAAYPFDAEIVSVTLKNDQQIDTLARVAARMKSLREIEIYAEVTDAGASKLASLAGEFPNVNSLRITLTETTEDGLKKLSTFAGAKFMLINGQPLPGDNWIANFKDLETLLLRDERKSLNQHTWQDDDLRPIAELKELKQLELFVFGSDLSKVDLTVLSRLAQLRHLRVGFQIQPSQVESLKRELPNCSIDAWWSPTRVPGSMTCPPFMPQRLR